MIFTNTNCHLPRACCKKHFLRKIPLKRCNPVFSGIFILFGSLLPPETCPPLTPPKRGRTVSEGFRIQVSGAERELKARAQRGSKRKQEDFWLEAELRFPLASSLSFRYRYRLRSLASSCSSCFLLLPLASSLSSRYR